MVVADGTGRKWTETHIKGKQNTAWCAGKAPEHLQIMHAKLQKLQTNSKTNSVPMTVAETLHMAHPCPAITKPKRLELKSVPYSLMPSPPSSSLDSLIASPEKQWPVILYLVKHQAHWQPDIIICQLDASKSCLKMEESRWVAVLASSQWNSLSNQWNSCLISQTLGTVLQWM